MDNTNRSRARVLVVDDNDGVRGLLVTILKRLSCEPIEAASGEKGLEIVQAAGIDLAIVDYYLSKTGMDGMELTRRATEIHPNLPVVFITGSGTEEVMADALREGAAEYLSKPFKIEAVEEALLKHVPWHLGTGGDRVAAAVSRADAELAFAGISPRIQPICDTIRRVAPSNATVLIEGATGVGKEAFAQAIHRLSGRRGQPFVRLDCSVLGRGHNEAALYGSGPLAPEQADGDIWGLIMAAGGGTLFLDRVNEASHALQSILLGVVHEGVLRPIGAQDVRHVDVRIIASTATDLAEAMQSGRFRDDLLYCLNVVRVHVPPLRRRREDIPRLLQHCLQRRGGRDKRFSEEASGLLQAYDWPGNMRELDSFVQQMVATAPDQLIQSEHLPAHILTAGCAASADHGDYEAAKREFERRYFSRLLVITRGNMAKAAALAGMARSSLHGKLGSLGIDARRFQARGEGTDVDD